jgi:hypothetical protein
VSDTGTGGTLVLGGRTIPAGVHSERRSAGALKRLLIVAGVVLLGLAGAAVAATQVRWNGGIGHGYGNAVGMPMPVGAAFTFGMDDLRPSHRIRIEAVRLHHRHGAIELVGAVVHQTDRGMVGALRGFPPSRGYGPMRPAVGAVVEAGGAAALEIGLRATQPGTFDIAGIDLLYRERLLGVDVPREAHLGLRIYGCAVRTSSTVANCKLPPFSR